MAGWLLPLALFMELAAGPRPGPGPRLELVARFDGDDLRQFVEQRRAFLLAHPLVGRSRPLRRPAALTAAAEAHR